MGSESETAAPAVPPNVLVAVGDFRRRLVARFGQRLVKTILFGSHARGDFGPESDVDVLVVIEGLGMEERRQVFDLAWEVYPERLVYLSPLALSVQEWTALRAREYRIATEIEQEGIDL